MTATTTPQPATTKPGMGFCWKATLVDQAPADLLPVTVAQNLYLDGVHIPDATTGYIDEHGSFGYFLEAGALPGDPDRSVNVTLWVRVLDSNLTIDAETKRVTIFGVNVLTAPLEQYRRYPSRLEGRHVVWVPVQIGEVVIARRGSDLDPGFTPPA